MKRSMTPRKCQIFFMQISPADVQPAASVVNSSAANGSHRASAPMSYLGDTHSETTNRRFIIFICPSSSIHHQRSNIIIIFFFYGFVIPSSFLSRRLRLHLVVAGTGIQYSSLTRPLMLFRSSFSSSSSFFFLYASVPAPDDIIEPIVGR